MANEVKLKLAIEGGQVVGAEIDGVTTRLGQLDGNARAAASGLDKTTSASDSALGSFRKMAEAMTVASLATKAFETAVSQAGKVLDYMMESAKMAARYETLGVVMQTVGRNAGYTGQQMMDAAKGVQALGITMMESRDSVTKMASAQIDLAKAQGLARIAQDAAVIGGINSSEALKAMVYGIQSAQTDVLRTIGINVSFEESYKKLAIQLGTTSEALTEQEKTTARTGAVMESGAKIAGAYEDAMGTAGKQLTSMARYSEDAQVKLGTVFNDTLILAVATYTGHLKEANQGLDELAKNNALEDWSKSLAQTFAFVADSMKNSFSVIATVIDTIYTAMAQANAAASFRGGDVMRAGNDWKERVSQRFDPQGQMQVQNDQLQAKREADARTLHMPDKTVIVFETPEQKSAYQDGLAGIKKFEDDRQKVLDVAAEATTSALKKNRTEHQKINDEITRYTVTQVKAGIDINGKEQQAAIEAIREHGKEAKAVSEKVTAYDRLVKSISEKTASYQIDAQAEGNMTAGQKEAIKIMDDLRTGSLKLTDAQKINLTSKLELMLAAEQENLVINAASKATEQANKERQKDIDTSIKATATLQDQIKVQQDHNSGIGKTDEAIAALTAQRELDKASTLEALAIKELDRNLDYQKYDAVMAEVSAMRTLAAEKARGGRLETADKGAKDLLAAQKKAAEESGKYWEDALMRAFESGKGFFESLWDTIKNTLKTQVLKVMVQGVMGTLGVGAMGAASAGQGGSAMSGLGIAGNLASIYNGVSSMVTLGGQVVGGAMSVANALGTVAANATGTGISGLLATNGAYGTAAASTASGLGAGASSASVVPVVGWIMAAMAANGSLYDKGYKWDNKYAAIDPVVAITDGLWQRLGVSGKAAAVLSGSALQQYLGDKIFGSSNKEITASGIEGTFTNAGFLGNNYASYKKDGGWFHSDTTGKDISALAPDTVQSWSRSFAGMQAAVAATASSLGLETYQVYAYSKAIDIAAGSTAEQVTAIFSGMANDMATAAAPGIAALAKTGETASGTLQRLSTSITTANAWLSMLGKRLFDVSVGGADAASKLADAFGSLDNLGASSKAYYETYYTEAERTKRSSEDLAKAMAMVNVALPANKDAFRAVVTSLDLTTDAGRNACAVMLALAPEYAATSDAMARMAKDQADAAIKAAQDTAKAAADLAASNKGLQDQLDVLTGKTTSLSLAMRDAADISTAVLLAQVDAQTRLNEATAQAAADAKALKDALTSAGQGLSAFIGTLRLNGASAPATLGQTRATYNADLALAQAGNVDASNRLQSSGKAYLDAQNVMAASAVDMQRASALMASQLSALPATQSYEQKMLDAVNATTQSVTDLNGKLVTELTVTARSEIVKAISVIGTSDLSDDMKRLALLDTATVAHTIDLVLGSDLTDAQKRLALDAATSFNRVMNIIAGSALSDAQKTIAFDLASSFSRTINIVAGSTVSGTQIALALSSAAAFSRLINVASGTSLTESQRVTAFDAATAFNRTMNVVAGTSLTPSQLSLAQDAATYFNRYLNFTVGTDLDATQKALALGQATTDFNRTINAFGGLLTDEQKLLLNGQTDYSKTVLINTVVSSSADAIPAKHFGATIPYGGLAYTLDSWGEIDGPSGLHGPLLVASDGSTMGWSGGISNASLASVFASNMASGYPTGTPMYAAMASYGHDIGLPGFAVGTNAVPYDMTANIHKDERIIPAADNRELMARLQSPQQNNAALITELRRLRESNERLERRLQAIESNTSATAVHTANTADSTRRMDSQGVMVFTDPAAPIATKASA